MGDKKNAPNGEGIAYLFGRIEHEIESYAAALDCPPDFLTQRLAELLLNSRHGITNQMPNLRGHASSNRKTVAKVALASSPHRSKTQGSSPSPNSKPNKIKEYWMRMTPEQRSAEMTRRMKKSLTKKKG